MADGTRNPGKGSPALTGKRRPLYRLHKSDVVEIRFTFSPEFDQTVTVQPDGFVALKAAGNVLAEGLSLPALEDRIVTAYQPALLDPEVSVILKDFVTVQGLDWQRKKWGWLASNLLKNR